MKYANWRPRRCILGSRCNGSCSNLIHRFIPYLTYIPYRDTLEWLFLAATIHQADRTSARVGLLFSSLLLAEWPHMDASISFVKCFGRNKEEEKKGCLKLLVGVIHSKRPRKRSRAFLHCWDEEKRKLTYIEMGVVNDLTVTETFGENRLIPNTGDIKEEDGRSFIL